MLFWLCVKFVRFSLGSEKLYVSYSFAQILRYIFDINGKLLAHATDVKYFVSNLWQMHNRAFSWYFNT